MSEIDEEAWRRVCLDFPALLEDWLRPAIEAYKYYETQNAKKVTTCPTRYARGVKPTISAK